MNEYVARDIRNIALVGHGGSGKTTLMEAILYTIGVTTRMGSVADKNTVSDYSADEQARGYSLNATLAQVEHGGTKYNIIDTPGYTDFVGEAIGALRAVDNALFVLNAQTGVEVGTELLWGYADDYNLPRAILVNALSREHANFDAAIGQAKDRFGGSGTSVTIVQFPANQGEQFSQIVDVVSQKLYTYERGGKGVAKVSDIPATLAARAAQLREAFVEAVAESDEPLLEAYLEAGELDEETLMGGLRKAIRARMVIPVLCGDGQHNVGTDRLLEVCRIMLASPEDVGPIEAEVPGQPERKMQVSPTTDEPLCAYVFKTISEAHVGDLSFVRMYSGRLGQNVDVANTRQGTPERVGQSFFMIGKERTEAGHINAGDVGALVKLRNTHTGDTLCDPARQVVLAQVSWPKPNIEYAIVPRTKGDEDKIGNGLHRLHEEDPTFVHSVDGELSQTLIAGQGELHLAAVVKRLQDRYNVTVDLARPKIPYRETIRKMAEAHYRHKKQTGGRGQFGDVTLRVEPLERGGGYEFVDAIVGGVIPNKFIPAVEKGVVEAMTSGVIANMTVVDVRATLFDGSYHPVDSSEIAFKLAGLNAFKEAMRQASPVLLEPIYKIEVTVPEEYMGDVIGDLSSRRGKVSGMDSNGPFQVIRALVPLASLYRYSTDLRSMTGGRGYFTREFSHYEEVPPDVTAKIVEEVQKAKEEAS